MKNIFAILLSFFVLTAQAQLNLVPAPAEYTAGKGTFGISKQTVIVCAPSLNRHAVLLKDYLQSVYKLSLTITSQQRAANAINLSVKKIGTTAGAYTLNVNNTQADLTGDDEAGLFYGLQSLFQLLTPGEEDVINLPQLAIRDYPRFQYRGMHLDVARHFFPVSFVKKYIDYLAAYKFNTFHWHLTDDQGWRIEIKKYPLLTAVGGYRNGTITGRYPGKGNDSLRYGGFYTQAQIKEVIQYAAARYITVIPEIEMPGHASAAIAAYPQLSCFPTEDTRLPKGTVWSGSQKGKQVQQTWGVFEDVFAPTDYTFNFLQEVLDEVIKLFPSNYIHIGGDECPKEAWKRSDFCQQLIKEKGLKDEHGLQSYFIQRIEKYINSKGRKIIGWDEILEGGLAPNAAVMSWRGEEGGIAAAKQDHEVVMTPGSHVYLDHTQSRNEDSVTIGGFTPLEKTYSYEPIPAALNEVQAKKIMGAQANLWTEYIKNASKVEYMIFPRMIALSEVLWSPKAKRDWKDFERRLPFIFKTLEAKKINYSKAYFDLEATVQPTASGTYITWNLASKSDDGSIYYTDSRSRAGTLQYRKPIEINEDVKLTAWLTINGRDAGNGVTQKISFNKATGKKITLINPPAKNYPGNGAFTLVDGVQNEKGMSKSSEFLGFNGKDLDATIDLGKDTEVKEIVIHTLDHNGSWIYAPKELEISFIPFADTSIITRHAPIEAITVYTKDQKDPQRIVLTLPSPKFCRYVRVWVKNYGIIPTGNPGAGHEAWLFVDEIEIH